MCGVAAREPDIIAKGKPHDISYWRTHPDVVHVTSIDVEYQGEMSQHVWLWLRPVPDAELKPQRGYRPRPPRPRDLELYGDWLAHGTFWGRCPSLEHLEVFQEMPCPEAPEGWWVAHLWFSGPRT